MEYKDQVLLEMELWHREMIKKTSFFGKLSKGIQEKINKRIPQKIHEMITASIKNMVKAVLFGSEYTTKRVVETDKYSFEEKEKLAKQKLNSYKKTAVVEGAGTGAGGFLLGLVDFPLLLSIKMKFLFDLANIYGFDVNDYHERLYILYLFQLAFSSDKRRRKVYHDVYHWEEELVNLPKDLNELNWRLFQQEYRDYMDIAKMLQMIPGLGAAFGAYANYQLLDKLGKTAMNGYRLRLFKNEIGYMMKSEKSR